jgi:spermidine synthase
MKPRILINVAPVPGGGELKLYERDGAWTIMLGATELMGSRSPGSEEALATLVAERVGGDARVLIGGLGMGFTLRAALAAFGPEAAIVVAELVPAVVDWARGPLAPVFAGSLDDPRVSIVVDDVAAPIRDQGQAWDAILLDVDNGPDGLTRAGNNWLYGEAGLAAMRAALKPRGVLAIWSAEPDARFANRLKRAGFTTEEVAVRGGRSGRGARHTIWLARR